MNPAQMATALKEHHGIKHATVLAQGTAKLSRDLLSTETPGLGDEVQLQEYEEKGQTRTRFIVNEPMKAARLTSTMRFWMNVSAILTKEQIRLEALKQPKNHKH
jgi:hypothetical protein